MCVRGAAIADAANLRHFVSIHPGPEAFFASSEERSLKTYPIVQKKIIETVSSISVQLLKGMS